MGAAAEKHTCKMIYNL